MFFLTLKSIANMENLATYTFLPWLRQGVANHITGSDGSRAVIPIELVVNGRQVGGGDISPTSIQKEIQIYGPGDIAGLDSQNIIKVEPKQGISNFEPNYLPYIEFYDEDLPWRYSPLSNPDDDRLMPWMALIVLTEEEFEEHKNSKEFPLPAITFTQGNSTDFLPPSDQLWAWAHVHINEGIINAPLSDNPAELQTTLASTLQQDPDLAYARLVCPRRLVEKTTYHAFLVPVFETGRLAGLGQDNTGIDASAKAWTSDTVPSLMPYYHRWHFRTGAAGDFEYLVRLLKPQPVDSRVGLRDIDVQKPEANLQGLTDEALQGILKLGGALRIPLINYTNQELAEFQKYDNWASPYPHAFQENLAAFINLPDDYQHKSTILAHQEAAIVEATGEPLVPSEELTYPIGDNPDPLITAPIYGQWHALAQRLLTDREGNTAINHTNWVHELNLDPRWRVAAGFGGQVVQDNQENYMKSAWEQLGDVLEANKKIRVGQMVLLISQGYYYEHLQKIEQSDLEKWLSLAYPVSKRILMEDSTIYHTIKQSKIPQAIFSTPMRKFLRPRGKIARRLGEVSFSNIVERLNTGDITAAPPKTMPEGFNALLDVADQVRPGGLEELLAIFQQMGEELPECAHLFERLTQMLFEYYDRLPVCTDFRTTVGNFPAPFQENGVSFQPYNVSLAPEPRVQVIGSANPGLVTRRRLEIVLNEPTSWVSILYSSTVSAPTFTWLDDKGTVLGTQTPTEIGDLKEIHLNGSSIAHVIIDTPLQQALIHQFCHLSNKPGSNPDELINYADKILETSQTKDIVTTFPTSSSYRVVSPKGDDLQINWGGDDSEDAEEFKVALLDINTVFEVSRELGVIPTKPSVDLPLIGQTLFEQLNPQITVPRWTWGGVSIPNRILENLFDYYIEAMAYPEFDTPMYKPLVDHSTELFLPGLNYIAQNSISLLETNQKFIESYMVGLNHEFGRELLWREYPTDQRGSYFRQFWDAKSYLDSENLSDEDLKEKLKDIPPIHTWGQKSLLGGHDHREANGSSEEEVVLVIRGDLFKKYPNAVIYAHRAQWQLDDEGKIDPTQERVLVSLEEIEGNDNNPSRNKIKTPLYEAKVGADIHFFGFDLTACAAKGGSGREYVPNDPACAGTDITWEDPGWFFVIKERPGEPRFGLDIGDGGNIEGNKIELWNDLSWEEVSPEVNANAFIQVTGATPTIKANQILEDDDSEKEVQQVEDQSIVWSKNMSSAELAYILYQVPVLVGVHASEMLPAN